MKIETKTVSGSVVSVEIPQPIQRVIRQTSNRGPNGETAEQEMVHYLKEFMSALELAFAAPEPLRRSFVDILRANCTKTRQEMEVALMEVAEVFRQRVSTRN